MTRLQILETLLENIYCSRQTIRVLRLIWKYIRAKFKTKYGLPKH